MSEKTEKPKLSDKELKLIYLGAVVGAIASWVGNLVANGAAPPRVVEYLGPLLPILRVGAFFVVVWVLTLFLTFSLDLMGFFKFEG